MKKHAAKLLAVLLALAMVLALSACDQAAAGTETAAPAAESAQADGSAQEGASEVTVSASATVTQVPDKASISFGITSQDESAEQAQNKNAKAVSDVIAVLTDRGIAEKSIRTEYYSLYPQYDYSYSVPQLTGYTVTTTMSVHDQDLDQLGEVMSACVAAGITNVDSMNLMCSGYDEAYAQALDKAVEASRAKAETLAQAAGKTLGEVVNVTEGWQDTSARYGSLNASVNYREAAEGMGGGDDISIQPGESEITANVTVTYRMQ